MNDMMVRLLIVFFQAAKTKNNQNMSDHWTKSLQPVGDKLAQSPQHIDYMSIFRNIYKLNEKVYNNFNFK